MKRCPECGRTFNDETLRFCLYDGKPLTGDTPPGPAPPVSAAPPSDTAPPQTPPYTAPPVSTPPPVSYAAPPPPASPAPPPSYLPPAQYAAPPSYPPPLQYAAQPYGAAAPPKKSGWRWFGGLAALFLLVRVGLNLANPVKPHSSSGTRPVETKPAEGGGTQPETQPVTSPPDNNPSQSSPSESALRDSLVSAIKQADNAQTQALSDWDPAPLYAAYSGPALQKQIQTLQTLKNTGFTMEGRLLSQDFGTFHVNANQSEAQVEVSEKWSLSFYSASTHKLLRSQPMNTFTQTLFLKRSGDGWAINDERDK